MAVNVWYLATWVLLMACLGMMIAACTLSEWTTHRLLHLGLWESCARLTTTSDFTCGSVPDQGDNNAYLVTVQVTAVWGTVTVFLAFCLCPLVLFAKRPMAAVHAAITGCNVLSVIMLIIAWGCWLGVHSPYGKAGADLGASWMMAVISWALMLAATATGVWGWRASKPPAPAAGGRAVDLAPGMSEDEAALPPYAYPDLKVNDSPESFSIETPLPPTRNEEAAPTVNHPPPQPAEP